MCSEHGLRPLIANHTITRATAARHELSETVIDAITGHTQLTIGRGYAVPTLEDMAKALQRFDLNLRKPHEEVSWKSRKIPSLTQWRFDRYRGASDGWDPAGDWQAVCIGPAAD